METPTSEPARANVRRAWTPHEDQILQCEAEIQLQNGSLRDWKLIATKLPHRTNKDCRKRWSKICDSVNKGPWSRREDKALEQAIAEVGTQWISVAKRVGTRHADQCAKRWRHFLDPDLDHSQWGPEDDTRLWAAVLDYGTNWRKVVEEEFPERSPTNVKNRYAVIKNLRRRGKNLAATTASDDVAMSIKATTSLSTKAANDGCQGSNFSNSNRSAAGPDTPMSFGNAVYSGGATDDDFAFLLHDSSTPQTPYSSAGMESLIDANSRFSPDSQPTSLAPSSTLRMQHCSKATTPSTDEHTRDGMEHDSLVLDDFPQMELGMTNSFGDEAQNELWWEPQQTGSVGDGWMPSSAMEGLVADPSLLSSCSMHHASGEARRVSLFLEDMQPETANRVTTMLLNGNVDLKMKMTIR